MLQEFGLGLQALRGTQASIPDRRIAGVLGKFTKPRSKLAKIERVGHRRFDLASMARAYLRTGGRPCEGLHTLVKLFDIERAVARDRCRQQRGEGWCG